MIRKHLVAALDRVAPALSSNDLVPILSHLCFNKTHVFAFNEQIGLVAPCKTDFDGAVPGRLMLALLSASKSKEVEFNIGANELIVKSKGSSSRMKLPMLEKKRFVWEPPKLAQATLSVHTKPFLKAISCCLRSVSIDTTVPDQLGVTLIADDNTLLMFATDNATMSHAELKLSRPAKFDRVILSGAFCQQLLAIADPDKKLHLEIYKDHALVAGAGGTILFGKLVHSERPINFEKRFETHFPDNMRKSLVSVPTKLELILERACIVSAANGEPVTTEIEVKSGVATFKTLAKVTEVRDSMQVEKQQKDTFIAVNPKLLKNGYGSFSRMMIQDKCIIMADDGVAYLVAGE